MDDFVDAFDGLGLSPALGRIIRYYLVRPDARPHQRALQRALDLGSASVRRETDRLQRLGVLRARQEENRTVYTVAQRAPLWRALQDLAGTSGDPSAILRDALVDVEGIAAAFIFGSVARGTQREDSDIDLFVLEAAAFDRSRFHRRLTEVTLLLGREVRGIRYTPRQLGERLGDPAHPGHDFLREVLTGEQVWVAGSPGELAPIVAAAGLPTEALEPRAA